MSLPFSALVCSVPLPPSLSFSPSCHFEDLSSPLYPLNLSFSISLIYLCSSKVPPCSLLVYVSHVQSLLLARHTESVCSVYWTGLQSPCLPYTPSLTLSPLLLLPLLFLFLSLSVWELSSAELEGARTVGERWRPRKQGHMVPWVAGRLGFRCDPHCWRSTAPYRPQHHSPGPGLRLLLCSTRSSSLWPALVPCLPPF